MKAFHLTESSNVPSILKIGLRPYEVMIPSHLERFKKHYGLKNGKVIYAWIKTKPRRDRKLVGDMVYCKQVLSPRSFLYKYCGGYTDHFEGFPETKYQELDYTLLEIDLGRVPKETILFKGEHDQVSDRIETSTAYALDPRYTHRKKRLIVFRRILKPAWISIAGRFRSEIRDGKLLVRKLKSYNRCSGDSP